MEIEFWIAFEILYLGVCVEGASFLFFFLIVHVPCVWPHFTGHGGINYYLDGTTLLFSSAPWGAGRTAKERESRDSL